MNSLLKRQIRKLVPEYLQQNKDLEVFFDAVSRSYTTLDDQFLMLQRATAISSEELFEATLQLKEETNQQKEIIKKLRKVINTLELHDLNEWETVEDTNSLKLVDFIDHQTKEILKITQQKDVLLKKLERQNSELNDYAHMVSHDLVSPLQNIETLVHVLEDDYKEVISSLGVQKLKLISDNIERIDILVRAIRDYSSIKHITKEYTCLDLHKLIEEAILGLNFNKHVKINIKSELPQLRVDRLGFKHLFVNLIQNAVKYNTNETKNVEISCEEEEFHWKFSVKDNGVGIAQPYINKVFGAFYKLENNSNSAGMGLSIAKKVVDLYDGKLWVESEKNKGSVFHFTIKKSDECVSA